MALANLAAATSGSVGAAFSSTLLYPLDVAKAHLNKGVDSRGRAYVGFLDVCRRLYMEHGILGFYFGIQVRTFQQVVQKFVFYYTYDGFRRAYQVIAAAKMTLLPNLAVGYVAGVATLLASSPFEVVSTRQQLGVVGSGDQASSLLTLMKEMARDEGISSFYRGLAANLFLCLNPAIENTLFDQAGCMETFEGRASASRRHHGHKSLRMVQAFWLGAASKVVATALTFPYIRAKVILQSMAGGAKQLDRNGGQCISHPTLAPSTLQVLRGIVLDEGVLALWKGIVPQATKGVLSSAVLLAVKEKIDLVIRIVIFGAFGKRSK